MMISSTVVLIFFTLLAHVTSQRYLVVTPSSIQPGQDHKVFISVYNVEGSNVPVTIFVELANGVQLFKTPIISVSQGSASQSIIRVPVSVLTALNSLPDYVFVRAVSNHPILTFDSRKRVMLSWKTLSVFVQTDKPIYVRDDKVNIRIVAVNCLLVPKDQTKVLIDIKNPNNIITQRFELEMNSGSSRTIKRHSIDLGPWPIEGQWTIKAKYGILGMITSEFHFEVLDYVLPRFDVVIIPPKHVTQGDKKIEFTVKAKYTYGKGVQGVLTVRLGILQDGSGNVTEFFNDKFAISPDEDGTKDISVDNLRYGHFPFGDKLWIYAEVIERGSGIRQSTKDTSIAFSSSRYIIECDPINNFYQLGILITGCVRVLYQYGKAAEDIAIEFAMSGSAVQVVQTDDQGNACYSFPASRKVSSRIISVRPQREQVSTSCLLEPIQPPCSSSNSISIVPPRLGEIRADYESFQIQRHTSSSNTITVTVMVIARGLLQYSTTLSIIGSQATLSILVQKKWAKKFHMLAYYHDTTCDAIVADAKTLYMEEAFDNDVKISPNYHTSEPGKQIKLTITGQPHSDIALLAVDAGLYVLNNENKLTREQVFEELDDFDRTCPITKFTSNGLFEAYGISVMSNTQLSTNDRVSGSHCSTRSKRSVGNEAGQRCCTNIGRQIRERIINQSENWETEDLDSLANACNDYIRRVASGARGTHDIVWNCPREEWCFQYYMAGCVPSEWRAKTSASQGSSQFPEGQLVVQRRSSFPHVWLVNDELSTGSSGSRTTDVNVPDSITTWVLHAIGLSEKGFGVAVPFNLRAYKSVFVECHVPFSVRRQEQVSIACTAYNYGPDTTGFMRVKETSDGVCTKAGVRDQTDYIQFPLKQSSTETILIPLVPLKVGTVTLTVELVTSIGVSDIVDVAIKVEETGVTHEKHFSAELDPEAMNVGPSRRSSNPGGGFGCCHSLQEYNGVCRSCSGRLFTKEECCNMECPHGNAVWGPRCEACPLTQETRPKDDTQQNLFKIELPDNSIPGTVEAWVSVSGRYLRGNMKIQIETNVISQLRQPGGCGEQNMANFAPNVAILKYLKGKGKLSPEEEEILTDHVSRTYQYQLQFRTSDGGFSIYPDRPTKTWLTAFVLKCICAAIDITFIDEQVFSGIHTSLLSHQHGTGEFYEDSSYSSSIIGDKVLTAYVVIGLLECCGQSNYTLARDTEDAVCRAVEFMEVQIMQDGLKTDHSRAMVFYALSLACIRCRVCTCRSDLLASLYNSINDMEMQDRPRRRDIETASYILCAYVAREELSRARPVAKWLNSARSSSGLLTTSHDTSLGLKCLGDFALLVNVRQSMTVNLTSLGCRSRFRRQLTIDRGNMDVQQQIEIPADQALKVITAGTGLGIVQVHVSYKVTDTDNDTCSYNFSVKAKTLGGNNNLPSSESILIECCARYLGDEYTDMVMMDVEIPTGYVACEDREGDPHCLKQLKKFGDESGLVLDRYEVTGRSVFLHIQRVPSNKMVCLTFKATHKFPVEHISPVAARIYSYYDPDKECTVFYTPDNSNPELAVMGCETSANDKSPLCLCGAGHCPKLADIKDRLCQVCWHHHYAYKVQLKKILKANMWLKYRCEIKEVFKAGLHNISEGDRVVFWAQEICRLSIPLVEGEEYHVMGIDGPRFLLDHNSKIELWKDDDQTNPDRGCIGKSKNDCLDKKCAGKEGKARNKCRKNRKEKCTAEAKASCLSSTCFSQYLYRIRKDRHVCEERSICDSKC